MTVTNFYFDANGIRLHALVHGERARKPPLVFLHGFMDHAHAWDRVIAQLQEEYWCVALDFRGFGDSGWHPHGTYAFAEYQLDVACLLRALDLSRAIFVGHSMGGNIATQYAAVFPEQVERLILVEGFGPPQRTADEFPERTARWVRRLLDGRREHPRVMATLAEVAARLQETNPHMIDELADYIAGHAVRRQGEGYVWKFDPCHRLPAPHPYTPDDFIPFWKRLTVPTLSLHGGSGPFTVEALQERYQHFGRLQTDVIDDAAHGIHVEQPEALDRRIRQFVGEGK